MRGEGSLHREQALLHVQMKRGRLTAPPQPVLSMHLHACIPLPPTHTRACTTHPGVSLRASAVIGFPCREREFNEEQPSSTSLGIACTLHASMHSMWAQGARAVQCKSHRRSRVTHKVCLLISRRKTGSAAINQPQRTAQHAGGGSQADGTSMLWFRCSQGLLPPTHIILVPLFPRPAATHPHHYCCHPSHIITAAAHPHYHCPQAPPPHPPVVIHLQQLQVGETGQRRRHLLYPVAGEAELLQLAALGQRWRDGRQAVALDGQGLQPCQRRETVRQSACTSERPPQASRKSWHSNVGMKKRNPELQHRA
jgi:hypothetical protein